MIGDYHLFIILTEIIGGTIFLYYGGEYLVKGGSHLAQLLGVSPLVIGLTVVAFGTSLPEMVVSLVAALEGTTTISTGNIIGSNVANVGLVIGLSVILFSMNVVSPRFKYDLYFLFIVSIIFSLMAMNHLIQRWEGVVLLTGIFLYIYFYVTSRREAPINNGELGTIILNVVFVIIGIIGLGVGSKLFVKGAVDLASLLHVSQFIIGLTVVALGTSLPELATSLVAAYRQETDISIGNIIGSNLFNILAVMGLVGTITPLTVEKNAIYFELPVMILFTLALFPLIKMKSHIPRIYGVILLIGYVGFLTILFLR